jgi:hypothetical protein
MRHGGHDAWTAIDRSVKRSAEGGQVTTRYEIIVAGEAGPMLLSAFEGFETLPSEPGHVRLVGTVRDEAALHTALHRLQDLRAELIEVRRLPQE